jgi:hypothetical protein
MICLEEEKICGRGFESRERNTPGELLGLAFFLFLKHISIKNDSFNPKCLKLIAPSQIKKITLKVEILVAHLLNRKRN